MSWNSMATDSALELIVFQNRIRKRLMYLQICKRPDWRIVIDRAHRICLDYTDQKNQKNPQLVCKSIIVCFTSFCYCAAFYRAQRYIGNRTPVRLDLTKQRYDIWKAWNEYIKSIGHTAKLFMLVSTAEWKLNGQFQDFFESLQYLKNLVDVNGWKVE